MEPCESWAALAAGGVAGVCVDLILFPLDTVKTRLQSPQGFRKAGGFRGIYAGVPSAAIGSFPNAAAFFITYENVKSVLHPGSASYLSPATHMVAASLGEVVACLIRVPSEVIKQRAQVSPSSTTLQILSHTLYHEGIQGLYRGYKSTVLREIPFSLVQFPLWESLKDLWSWKQGHVVDSWQSAVCGAFAACLQALSRGWQPSAWEASSSLGHTRRLASCCSDPAGLVLSVATEELQKLLSWKRILPRNAAFLLPPLAVPEQLFSLLSAAFTVEEK
ncbi:S-adenosylmethionine mitochondrial carrier protein isoform X1 [Apus apus]|uniref:S-adenosylmethionine mitochondrial carrier protein isoform X1 n=1 Tax=Apus apus TaxID=8895 RepID=UPI0021F8695E|nr:S-adenosylmethionine mitochondrial carrier protein isoform X1 [Apus apus]